MTTKPLPLLIELGNTHWKAARYYRENLKEQQLQLLAKGELSQELLLQEQPDKQDLRTWFAQQQEQQIVVASVASKVIEQALEQHLVSLGKQVTFIRTSSYPQLLPCYQEIERLGVDRWLTLIAILARQQSALIIDAGTATTVDVLLYDSSAQQGQHLGGWIAPGVHLMEQSLVQRSSRLAHRAQTEIQNKSKQSFADNTADAVSLGSRAALRGLVYEAVSLAEKHVIEKYVAEQHGVQKDLVQKDKAQACYPLEVILLGGSAPYLEEALDLTLLATIAPQLELQLTQSPLLVFEGMWAWYQATQA